MPERAAMADDSAALIWDRDGRNWPNREASRFVRAGGIVWHVQQFGQGPPALLLHGTGASTHSWAWLAPVLSGHFSLIVPDLPGHAFTGTLPAAQMTLPGMAAGVNALLAELRIKPQLAIGHSAGAAVLARMALDGGTTPPLLIAVNGALTPFAGFASRVFPALAKLLFVNPLTSRFFAWRASRGDVVKRLIEDTGSQIPAQSLAIYERMFRSSSHCAGALAMMANWDLDGLYSDLPQLRPRLLHIVGSNDRAIPPDCAFDIAKRVPGSTVELLRGAGHLAHEEQPHQVGQAIIRAASTVEGVEFVSQT
jgi:magnesium chelatase accessory protein